MLTRKSLFPTRKSKMLARKSLFLTRQTRLTPSWRDGWGARQALRQIAQPMSYQSELVHFLTGHASAWVMSQSKNTPCTRADWPRISFALNSACPWRSAARAPGRVLPSIRGFTNSAVVPRGIRRRRPGAAERTTDHSQRRNRLRTGFGLLHFPRAVFEAGLKS